MASTYVPIQQTTYWHFFRCSIPFPTSSATYIASQPNDSQLYKCTAIYTRIYVLLHFNSFFSLSLSLSTFSSTFLAAECKKDVFRQLGYGYVRVVYDSIEQVLGHLNQLTERYFRIIKQLALADIADSSSQIVRGGRGKNILKGGRKEEEEGQSFHPRREPTVPTSRSERISAVRKSSIYFLKAHFLFN